MYTLWHGQLRDRHNSFRRAMLQRFHFDPFQDIAIDESGCRRWNSLKPELHEAIRAYFRERKEDAPENAP